MRNLITLLIIFYSCLLFAQESPTKIVIKNSSLYINDTCLYGNKNVIIGEFNKIKSIIKNDKYFKINKRKSGCVEYFFTGKGLSLTYGWNNKLGPPSIDLYFSLDTTWYNLFYKKIFNKVGKYQSSCQLEGLKIDNSTTLKDLRNSQYFKNLIDEKQENQTSYSINTIDFSYFFQFEDKNNNSKIMMVSIQYYYHY